MKQTYCIPCTWMSYGSIFVEASGAKEAIAAAYKCSYLPDGNYVSDSFAVDEERLQELYPEEFAKSDRLEDATSS